MTATGARRAPAGRRVIGLVAAVVCAVGALVLLAGLLDPRPYITGSNSVRARGYVIGVDPGQRLCLPRVFVPAETAQVQMQFLHDNGIPPLRMTLRAGDERFVRTSEAVEGPGASKVEWPIPQRPGDPDETVQGSLCVENAGPPGAPGVMAGGTFGAPGNDPAPELDGAPQDMQIALWYLPPAGSERSILEQLPAIMRRASILRPGWVGPWTPWVLVLGLVPLLGFVTLRTMARVADGPGPRVRGRRVPLGLVVALVGFGNAAAWATLTPSFDAPDESEHVAYAQYLAETGNAIDREVRPGRVPYSDDEVIAIQAMRALAHNEPGDGRPPWLELEDRRYHERRAAEQPRRDNGGGQTTCCNPHSPVYYGLLAPAYHLAGDNFFSRLWAMRLTSSLLAALVALCAFGIARLLLPERPEMAVAAGALVAFEPMFAFMGGSVNNDMGVNAGSAVVLYLLVRALRLGLSWRLGIALGVALAVLPLFKGTGYAMFPIASFAAAGVLWRAWAGEERSGRRARLRGALLGIGAALACLVAVTMLWRAVAPAFDSGTFTTPGGGVPGEGLAPLTNPGGYLSYLWQVFFPPLPFMTDLWLQKWPFYDIYIVRGWGAFGWYQVLYPRPVYAGIVALLAIMVVLGIVAIVRQTASVRERGFEAIALLGAGAAIIAGVAAFYYSPAPRGLIVAEMGRYAFPAIAGFAALAVAACYGAGRSRAPVLAAALAAGMVVLNTVGQFVMLAGFYT